MTVARLGVDVGGTFTDMVVVSEEGVITAKVPSTADQSDGVLAACDAAGVVAEEIGAFAHGTTVATNALLERRGADVALVTTEGFRDVIEIGRQNRPSLYDLSARRPPPLVPRERRFTVPERMGPKGELIPLDRRVLDDVIEGIRKSGVEAVAICFLFSHLHPEHETEAAGLIREAMPDAYVCASSEVLPEFREFERFSTTVANAYLVPRLRGYLDTLAHKARDRGLPAPLVMRSTGGVIDAVEAAELAAACVLSGPAGGVVGAASVAAESGFDDVLSFDMGGTSTDVAPIVEGRARDTVEAMVAGVPLRFPMVDVHTVSAGGGSIAWIDEGDALRVGPRSAGADPGPACYGRGGSEPTVTDANLLLGFLQDGGILGGRIALQRPSAEAAIRRLSERLGSDEIATALGIRRVANAEMVRALRVITVERGLDPRSFALCAFGGAGPMHACDLAGELGIRTVLIPRASGVLSALGLAVSDLRRDVAEAFPRSLRDVSKPDLLQRFDRLEKEAARDLADARIVRRADLRYTGQSYELTVPADDLSELGERFHDAHERMYGYHVEDEEIEIVSLRVAAMVPVPRVHPSEPSPSGAGQTSARRAYFESRWTEAHGMERAAMGAGSKLEGPSIVEFDEATCVVPPGWRGEIDDVGTLLLESS
jgi:N-methylhydantoinase A